MRCNCMSCREKELKNERSNQRQPREVEARSVYRQWSVVFKDDRLRELRRELRQEDNPTSD